MEGRDHNIFDRMRAAVDNPELAIEDEINAIQNELSDKEGRTITREEAITLIERREKREREVLNAVPDVSEPPLDHQRGWEINQEDFNEKLYGPNGLGYKGDASSSKEEPTTPSKP